jgi:SAM-dependent methyltransferase
MHSTHASLDLDSRRRKAEKVLRILELDPSAGPTLDVLEIGCGSGGISHYLGTLPGPRFRVNAVDVEDLRVVKDGYAFTRVAGTKLPFDDGRFDLVVSNHVIEHVGPREEQLAHLREIGRVLRSTGTGYLAVPSRWQVVEPHFRLPFLGWLPRRLGDLYVRIARRGRAYDCRPLSLRQIDRLVAESRMVGTNAGVSAVRAMLAIESGGWRLARSLLRHVPDGVLSMILPLFPTHVLVLQPDPGARKPGQVAAGGGH